MAYSRRSRKARIDDLIIQGIFSEDTYKENIAEIERVRAAKQLDLEKIRTEGNNARVCVGHCKEFLSNPATLWFDGDVMMKYEFQNLLFPTGIKI